MRSLGGIATAAIGSPGFSSGVAVEIQKAVGYLRWTDVQGGVTIGGNSFTARPLRVDGQIAYGDPALSELTLTISDLDDVIKTESRTNGLKRLPVRVWLLISDGTGIEAVELYSGAIDRPAMKVDWAKLTLGARFALWGLIVPTRFSAMCRYRSTAQCAFVATCAKTYTACQANAQTAIFGGFRFLLPSGTQITFRDQSVTVGGGEGTVTPVQPPTRGWGN